MFLKLVELLTAVISLIAALLNLSKARKQRPKHKKGHRR